MRYIKLFYFCIFTITLIGTPLSNASSINIKFLYGKDLHELLNVKEVLGGKIPPLFTEREQEESQIKHIENLKQTEIFYNLLNTFYSQPFILKELNSNNTLKEFYLTNDGINSEKVLNFIKDHKLNSKQILLLLIPHLNPKSFIKEDSPYFQPSKNYQKIPSKEIIKIIEKTNIPLDTLIESEDLNTYNESDNTHNTSQNLQKNFTLTSLVHELAASNNTALIHYLLSQSDNKIINIQNKIGNTPLMHLSEFTQTQTQNNIDWIGFISEINSEWDMDAQNIHGNSLFLLLSQYGSKIEIKHLSQLKNVNKFITNNKNENALLLAAINNRSDIISFFKEAKIFNEQNMQPSIDHHFLTIRYEPIIITPLLRFEGLMYSNLNVLNFKKNINDHHKSHNDKNIQGISSDKFDTSVNVMTSYLNTVNYIKQTRSKILSYFSNDAKVTELVTAIKRDDVETIKKLYLTQEGRSLVNSFISVKEENGESIKKIHIDNFLLIAIRHEAVKIVHFLLDNIMNENLFYPQYQPIKTLQKNDIIEDFIFLDPLSEVLVELSSSDIDYINKKKEEERQSSLKEIFKILVNHKKIDLSYQNIMGLTPMTTAITMNQLEAVKNLHEQKNIPLSLEGLLWKKVNLSIKEITEGTEVGKYLSETNCRNFFKSNSNNIH